MISKKEASIRGNKYKSVRLKKFEKMVDKILSVWQRGEMVSIGPCDCKDLYVGDFTIGEVNVFAREYRKLGWKVTVGGRECDYSCNPSRDFCICGCDWHLFFK